MQRVPTYLKSAIVDNDRTCPVLAVVTSLRADEPAPAHARKVLTQAGMPAEASDCTATALTRLLLSTATKGGDVPLEERWASHHHSVLVQAWGAAVSPGNGGADLALASAIMGILHKRCFRHCNTTRDVWLKVVTSHLSLTMIPAAIPQGTAIILHILAQVLPHATPTENNRFISKINLVQHLCQRGYLQVVQHVLPQASTHALSIGLMKACQQGHGDLVRFLAGQPGRHRRYRLFDIFPEVLDTIMEMHHHLRPRILDDFMAAVDTATLCGAADSDRLLFTISANAQARRRHAVDMLQKLTVSGILQLDNVSVARIQDAWRRLYSFCSQEELAELLAPGGAFHAFRGAAIVSALKHRRGPQVTVLRAIMITGEEAPRLSHMGDAADFLCLEVAMSLRRAASSGTPCDLGAFRFILEDFIPFACELQSDTPGDVATHLFLSSAAWVWSCARLPHLRLLAALPASHPLAATPRVRFQFLVHRVNESPLELTPQELRHYVFHMDNGWAKGDIFSLMLELLKSWAESAVWFMITEFYAGNFFTAWQRAAMRSVLAKSLYLPHISAMVRHMSAMDRVRPRFFLLGLRDLREKGRVSSVAVPTTRRCTRSNKNRRRR